MERTKSEVEFERAQKSIPGGVNSPVRAFKSVGTTPVYFAKAKGSKVYDIDGNEYIDFVASWGPLLVGHSHPEIVKAIQAQAELGTSYGAPTIQETFLAEKIKKFIPSIEKVRMVSSGTEATMSAIRLARGFTGRSKIIKFSGCYHGHADSFLIKAGSGAITLGLPNSPGVTEGTAKDTLIAEYNNIESVKELFNIYADSIACIIVEPVAGNMGVIPPKKEFLQQLRDVTNQYGALLIFDEVITGFRLAGGSAQKYFGIKPDLTTLGKIIGGGLPVGAFGGREDIMNMLAPLGPVYQAGTLSGNPLAMSAGLALLNYIDSKDNFYNELEEKAVYVENGLKRNLEISGVKGIINRVGSMLTLFFSDVEKIESYDECATSNTEIYKQYFNLSLEAGIYLAPSQFEAMFISDAHTFEDLDQMLSASLKALKVIGGK
ncbi:MAG: glutamate-1-semialdehyde 2,1-aminomutase [Candidatus Delongbacteria bacterium]|nr:glutamate-1-semialdehyde 2,1-aminomutase [Candidatus Delongbacteria bacterium]MBN2834964.1 glutamate-1-semialdehyde 2,1-aminomutase [Candidatus Delongbacteria bacterium]